MFPKGGMQGLVKQAQEMQKKMKRVEDELIDKFLRFNINHPYYLVDYLDDWCKNQYYLI